MGVSYNGDEPDNDSPNEEEFIIPDILKEVYQLLNDVKETDGLNKILIHILTNKYNGDSDIRQIELLHYIPAFPVGVNLILALYDNGSENNNISEILEKYLYSKILSKYLAINDVFDDGGDIIYSTRITAVILHSLGLVSHHIVNNLETLSQPSIYLDNPAVINKLNELI